MSTSNISLGGGGKGGRCAGLTTLPLSCANCLEIWDPQPSGTLWVCSRPEQGLLHLFTVLLEYDTVDNRIPTFRDSVLPSSSRVELFMKAFFSDISSFEDVNSAPFRNGGIHFPMTQRHTREERKPQLNPRETSKLRSLFQSRRDDALRLHYVLFPNNA
jgi:hypothetical protein